MLNLTAHRILMMGATLILAACGGGGGGGGSGTPPAAGPTLNTIAVTPASPGIAAGLTQAFTATGTYSDGTTKDLTATATWSSATPAVATVAPGGLATGVSMGTSVISAASGSVSGNTTLTVSAATMVSIAITPASLSLPKGATQQFTATLNYSDKTTQDVTGTVVWTSSNPAVGAFSTTTNGSLVAVGPGTASLSVTLAAFSGTAPPVTLTVTPAALAFIDITPGNHTIINGATQQFTATGIYTDNSQVDLTATATWTSGTPGVATITSTGSSRGLATGIAVGTSALTAALNNLTSAPITLTVSPKEFVYATNFGGGTVSQYAVQPDGSLAPISVNGVPTPTVLAGTDPFAIAVDSTFHFVYVVNYSGGGAGSVSQYTIGTDGSLTAVSVSGTPTPSVPAGNGPNGVTTLGTNLYVANFVDGTVSHYTLDTSTGALTFGETVNAGAGAAMVAIDPLGHFAYVPNYSDDTVSVFSVGPGGALALVSTTILPAPSSGRNDPASVVVDGTGQYAYVGGKGQSYVVEYALNAADGSLTALPINTVASGGAPVALALNPAANRVYSANSGDSVWQFNVGADGTLSTGPMLTLTPGSNPSGIVIDPTGQYAYVADRGAATVAQFTVGPDGTLTPFGTPTVAAGTNPTSVVVSQAHP